MVKKRIFSFILTAILLSLFPGCNTPPDPKYFRDGSQYGEVDGLFRERWWNYYERGVSFSEGGFWEEAAADFKEAVKQRDRDQRRARTYGMHFVDYFPRRDLGVAYYHLGRHEQARIELKKSLSSVETGKTKFYLNRVRKALLEASNADTAHPVINVASVSEGEVTNRFNLMVEGIVEDDSYAYRIAINEDPQFVELSAKRLPFSKKVKLKKGLNEISIKTSDLLGKMTEKKLKVFADFEGPVLQLNNYTDGQEVTESNVVLKGMLADATGVSMLRINGRTFKYNRERKVRFSSRVDLTEGRNRIAVSAADIAGNITTAEIILDRVAEYTGKGGAPSRTSKKEEPIRFALQGSGILDTGQHRLFASAPKQKTANFRLNLKDLTKTQTVYYDEIYIDGSVSGVSTIKSVTVNGSPLFIIQGKNIYFNQLVNLQEGENKLIIEVCDVKGNKTSKTVTVIREIQKVHQTGSRMSLAILPFETNGKITSAGSIVYDNLVSSFYNQGRFNIVSRGAELESVLRELKLSATDLVDKSKAIEIGRLIAAEGILTGSIRETKNSIEIYARYINTETSILLEAKDVYSQDKSLPNLQHITNGLALKFKHSFPLLEGIVIKVSGKNIYADFGAVHRIKKEMKFIVFREGKTIVHPVTGKVLGSDSEELGEARVINVYEDMSIGKLVAAFDPARIHVKDLIVTK